MSVARFFAFGLLSIAPAIVLYAAADARHEVAAGSKWSIDDSLCEIAAGWDGGVRIVVKPDYPNPGGHDIAVHNPAFKNFAPGQLAFVRFGAAGQPAGQDEYSAMGYRESKSSYYLTRADDELLEAFATTSSFQFYRNDVLEIDLDMTGFAEALGAMRACEANGPVDPEKM